MQAEIYHAAVPANDHVPFPEQIAARCDRSEFREHDLGCSGGARE